MSLRRGDVCCPCRRRRSQFSSETSPKNVFIDLGVPVEPWDSNERFDDIAPVSSDTTARRLFSAALGCFAQRTKAKDTRQKALAVIFLESQSPPFPLLENVRIPNPNNMRSCQCYGSRLPLK